MNTPNQPNNYTELTEDILNIQFRDTNGYLVTVQVTQHFDLGDIPLTFCGILRIARDKGFSSRAENIIKLTANNALKGTEYVYEVSTGWKITGTTQGYA